MRRDVRKERCEEVRVRIVLCFFFFKQKTAYEIVSRDWSSDVCSSDLIKLMNVGARIRELSSNIKHPVSPAQMVFIEMRQFSFSAKWR